MRLREANRARCSRDREIPMPLSDLTESVASIGRRARPLQRHYHFVRPTLRHQRADKELARANASLSPTRLQHDGSAACDERKWNFRTRIGVGYRPTERSAIACLEVTHPRQRHCK